MPLAVQCGGMKGNCPHLQTKQNMRRVTKSGKPSSNPYASDREATGRDAYGMNLNCENQTYDQETG